MEEAPGLSKLKPPGFRVPFQGLRHLARRQWEDALRGRPSSEPPPSGGWALALRVALALDVLPTPVHVTGQGSAEARYLGLVRSAFAADPVQVDAWRRADEASGAAGGLRQRASRAVLAWFDGREVAEDLVALGRDASAAKLADVVADLAALRALTQLHRGDVDEARRSARRAFRIARTEELPHCLYLAGVVLARVRRFEERPYLALHILQGLRDVAPPLWEAWLSWEELLAGGSPLGFGRGPLAELTADLQRALALPVTARAEALANLAQRTTAPAWARAELRVLWLLSDPDAPLRDAPEDVLAWARGDRDAPPRGLGAVRAAGDPAPLAVVRVGSAGPPRRMLGLAFSGALLTSARPGRLERAISVLALASEGALRFEDFFLKVYGFAYDPVLHHSAAEVLLHRARELVGALGTIDRHDGKLRIRASEVFAVPDPRCQRSLDEVVLGALASAGRLSARGTAQHLSASLRSVHYSLRRLVDDGAIVTEKQGRQVVYRLEDSTFIEPTRPLVGRRPQ